MKNLFKILILTFFTFSYCCGLEETTKEEGNYKDGKKDGKNIFYDKDGKIYWSGTYKNGVLIDGGSIKSDKTFNLY